MVLQRAAVARTQAVFDQVELLVRLLQPVEAVDWFLFVNAPPPKGRMTRSGKREAGKLTFSSSFHKGFRQRQSETSPSARHDKHLALEVELAEPEWRAFGVGEFLFDRRCTPLATCDRTARRREVPALLLLLGDGRHQPQVRLTPVPDDETREPDSTAASAGYRIPKHARLGPLKGQRHDEAAVFKRLIGLGRRGRDSRVGKRGSDCLCAWKGERSEHESKRGSKQAKVLWYAFVLEDGRNRNIDGPGMIGHPLTHTHT